mmetsp:Transcript_78421/g.205811  ORF Transcript_78421/g.205811 Transcript_78421/m.205811 type:complete len:127 (-) Transcript_78421:134-514(-)
MCQLHSRFASRGLAFLQVYVAEAHADDEWPIGWTRRVSQHRTLGDRVRAVKLQEETLGIAPWRVCVDSMEEERSFLHVYGAWPFRFYIFGNGRVLYRADPKDCSYSIFELEERLLGYLGSSQTRGG